MNKYKKVIKPKEAVVKDEEEIRVTAAGSVSAYVSRAAKLYGELEKPFVTVTATGNALTKAVTTAEVIKRRFKGLHQITKVGTQDIVDEYEPLEEGLDKVTDTRSVPFIEIKLSKEALDTSDKGYQEPLDESKVTEIDVEEILKSRGRGGGRGKGRGKGKGKGKGEGKGKAKGKGKGNSAAAEAPATGKGKKGKGKGKDSPDEPAPKGKGKGKGKSKGYDDEPAKGTGKGKGKGKGKSEPPPPAKSKGKGKSSSYDAYPPVGKGKSKGKGSKGKPSAADDWYGNSRGGGGYDYGYSSGGYSSGGYDSYDGGYGTTSKGKGKDKGKGKGKAKGGQSWGW